MPFNGRSNLQVGLEDGRQYMFSRVLDVLPKDKTLLSIVESEGIENKDANPLIKNAIDQNDEKAIRFLLGTIQQERTSFLDVLQTMKICFQGLWIHYNTLMQLFIKRDILSKTIGHAHLPTHLWSSVGHSGSIVRTTNMPWTFHSQQTEENLLKLLGLSNSVDDHQHTNTSRTKTTFEVSIVAMEDTCKVGLKGVFRFLLFQHSPSHIYKTQFIKWVITWKWENMWKEQNIDQLLYYVFFLLSLSGYGITTIYIGPRLREEYWTTVAFTLLLHFIMELSMDLAKEEFAQMRTYIKDGRKLFPEERLWGVKYYLSSGWNIFETILCFLLIVGLGTFHILSIWDAMFLPWYQDIIATTIILAWIKVTKFYTFILLGEFETML